MNIMYHFSAHQTSLKIWTLMFSFLNVLLEVAVTVLGFPWCSQSLNSCLSLQFSLRVAAYIQLISLSILQCPGQWQRRKRKRGPVLVSADIHLHLLLAALNELLVEVLISVCRRSPLHAIWRSCAAPV